MKSQMTRFWDVADKFFLILPFPAKICQQTLGHVAYFEQLISKGRANMHPLHWQLKLHLSPVMDDPVTPVRSLEECRVCVVGGYRRRVMHLDPSPSALICLLLFTNALWTGWVEHLQNLTTAGIYGRPRRGNFISLYWR